MKAGLRIALAAAVLPVALALLGVLYAGARRRASVTHCRNNLRHLGGLASRNWENLDKKKSGRLFWQEVRQAQYLNVNGKWEVPAMEPFTCPVIHPGLHPNPEDAASIDYLGPRSLRAELRKMPREEPLGADRPGNHGSGGLVLRLDTSVDDLTPILEDRSGDAWQAALGALRD